MIYDHISQIDTYKGIDARIQKGLELLRTLDFSTIPVGKYVVDDDIYYMVQQHNSNDGAYRAEAHRKYADIQYMYKGIDRMGVARLTDAATEVEARPDNDVWFYDMPVDFVTLCEGMFVVLYPHDAHAPSVAVEKSTACHKIVVKVRVD